MGRNGNWVRIPGQAVMVEWGAESAESPHLREGPGSEGFSPFAGGWGRSRVERSTVPRNSSSSGVFSASQSSFHCEFLHTLRLGQGCLACENTGPWRLRRKKLLLVGRQLPARH